MAILPNFFIIGAPKAATSYVSARLAQHPDIFLPRVKEPHFFSCDSRTARFSRPDLRVQTRAAYLSLFGDARCRVVGEASTSYLWSSAAPTRITAELPPARFLAILRDPVRRAFSHYLNDVREGLESREFDVAVREDHAAEPKGWGITHLYVEAGLYYQQLCRWLSIVERDRMKVVLYEDLERDEDMVFGEILQFLDLGGDLAPRRPRVATNRASRPRNRLVAWTLHRKHLRRMYQLVTPWTVRCYLRERVLFTPLPRREPDERAADYLRGIYHAERHSLESLLGRTLPWA